MSGAGATGAGARGRLHRIALGAEDVVQRSVSQVLLRAGRPVRVVPFSGTSGAGGTRVTGRVLVQLSGAEPPTRATGGWQLLRRSTICSCRPVATRSC